MPISTSKYELLILDYGGVYSFEYELTNFEKIMRKAFGKVPSAEDKVQVTALSHRFAANELTTNQYVASVAKLLNAPVPRTEDFEDATISVTSPPSEAMRQLVTAVRDAGLKVSLLSNMYAFEVSKARPWGRYDGFDFVAFSAGAGTTKQDPLFFKETLDHFSIAADRALFVDDVLEYVEIAKSAGLHSLHADHFRFRHAEELVQAIHKELFDA